MLCSRQVLRNSIFLNFAYSRFLLEFISEFVYNQLNFYLIYKCSFCSFASMIRSDIWCMQYVRIIYETKFTNKKRDLKGGEDGGEVYWWNMCAVLIRHNLSTHTKPLYNTFQTNLFSFCISRQNFCL